MAACTALRGSRERSNEGPQNCVQARAMYTQRMGLRPEYDLPADPVIEWYKKDVDRTLLREHLKLSPQERLEKLVAFMRSLEALRAGRMSR